MHDNIKVVIIHGPNLNLLGEREPEIYGSMTLDEINDRIREFAKINNIGVDIMQSNHEGVIIDKIHEVRHNADGIIINPGAYTHYSYAIYDAILACNLPTVEVHLSDIRNREPFRQISVIAPACQKQIMGQGWRGYIAALEFLADKLRYENHDLG